MLASLTTITMTSDECHALGFNSFIILTTTNKPLKMMKNILVPTDFSDVAKNALSFAIKIARPLKGKITLLHTVPPVLVANDMGSFMYPDNFDEKIGVELNKKMDELIEVSDIQHVVAEKKIIKGLLKDSISDIIENEKIDLVVAGTKGAKGLESFFFGTNAVDIFESVKCPVLIVPEKAHYHSIKKILYATDFQYGDVHEIKKLCEIAKPFNAQIIVTHVNTSSNSFAEDEETLDWFAEIGDSFIDYNNIVYKLLFNKNVVDAIEHFASEQNVDIVCLSTLEKGFFEKLTSKSNTKTLAYNSQIPLLALHLENKNKLN